MAQSANLEDIRAARAELDAVIKEIRTVSGYENFLSPPSFDDVARAAEDCPLVYVAAADPGGLALIVQDGDVAHVPLDGLTAAALARRIASHLDVYGDYRVAPSSTRARWEASLEELTGWLWDEAMGPVLERLLGVTQVVIVPVGLLGFLPLHAAWTRDDTAVAGRRYVLDDLAVTYAPNARVLVEARKLADDLAPRRLLAVAEPWPVAGGALPMAQSEALIAAAAFPTEPVLLAREEATFLSFEWDAPDADVLHLACHGYADLANPLDSGLVMVGGSITLRRLLELPLRARLAVLSACETALPGTELPDEVVALPSGLLQAGVASVIASQWAVPDRATAMLMAEFYRCWRQDRLGPAVALARAQQWLRDTTNAEKRAHFAEAAHSEDPWLPHVVAEEFVDRLGRPDRRSHVGLSSWAAFTHFGA